MSREEIKSEFRLEKEPGHYVFNDYITDRNTSYQSILTSEIIN